uniref:Carbohydrate sulfotransferase n=1 Tax=Salarias fasciatus TaxID=181472 RepID=A0A672IHN6_SALFA
MTRACFPKRRLPCSLWFVLLFAAGGLVLFIHQQDLSEMVQQQGPVSLGNPAHYSVLSLCSETGSSSQSRRGAKVGQPGRLCSLFTISHAIAPLQCCWLTSKSSDEFKCVIVFSTCQTVLFKLHASSSDTPSLQPTSRTDLLSEARQQLMKEICAKYKSSISKTITRHHVKHLFVEDKYKLLYCQVPKAGCSNWKRTLMVLAGQASNTQSINHDTVHYGDHLKKLDSFDRQGIMQRLETYTKVMFVREPLERMVSAYRDKFENPNNYYHSLFGKPIISKYRANPSWAALKTGSGVTFKEFVQYLLDVHRPVGMDIHWEQANQLCNPCLIDYDFIGKFENMEEESNFLLRLAGAPPNLTLPSFKDRNPSDKRTSMQITEKYFTQVSALERQRVYDFYYMDYLMFNYSKPFKDLY